MDQSSSNNRMNHRIESIKKSIIEESNRIESVTCFYFTVGVFGSKARWACTVCRQLVKIRCIFGSYYFGLFSHTIRHVHQIYNYEYNLIMEHDTRPVFLFGIMVVLFLAMPYQIIMKTLHQCSINTNNTSLK